MIPKIIDNQPMRNIFECRVRFGHCGRLFLSQRVYKSASAETITISGSVFRDLSDLQSASTNAVHMSLLPL